MRKLSIAIIGLGKQGSKCFLPNLIKSDKFNLKAVCDLSVESTNKIKNEFKSYNFNVYNDQRELYSLEKLDCVVLALPHDQYLNSLKLAALNKVNVLKEKPFARTLEESHKVLDIVKSGRIKLMVACQFRYDPLYMKIKDLLSEIGSVCLAKCWYTIPSSQPNSKWRSNDYISGGGGIIRHRIPFN